MQTPNYKLEINRSGYYEARWSEKSEQTGKYRSKGWSTGRKDRVEADIAAKNFFASMQTIAAAQTPAGACTVADVCRGYLAAAETREVGPTQRYSLKAVCESLGHLTPGEVTSEALSEFVKRRKAGGCVNGTIRRDLNAFTAAMNWGVKNRKLERAEFPIIDLPPDSAPRDVWLDEDQERAFYAAAMADSDGLKRLSRVTRFVALALDTAARTEAIEDLTWDRVDFKAGKIDYNVPGRKLTKKRRTVVPISDRLLPVLERAYQERIGNYVLDPGDIRKAWQTFVRASAWPHIRKHDLRRTWATLAARAGVDMFQIAGVLGDDYGTVDKHYAKHLPEHLRGAVNARFKSQAPVEAPAPAEAIQKARAA